MRSDYRGIPFEELLIDSIEWTEERRQHVEQRAERKGRPNEYSPTAAEATDAVFDPDRVVTDSGSHTGETIAVIGQSPKTGHLLTVIIYPKDFPPTGDWLGATAFAVSHQDLVIYQRHKQEGRPSDA